MHLCLTLDLGVKVTQNVAQYYIMWPMHAQILKLVWFRRCIYKKIHYLTFDLEVKVGHIICC